MNAVDTNILLYSADDNEPAKQAKAQALIDQLVASGSTVLFWQVLAETVNQLRQWKNRGELTDMEFDEHVQFFRNLFPLSVPSLVVLDHALDLAKRYSPSYWDSLILGACKDAGVTTLYTEDIGSSAVIDGIQLVNPLI
ncbi:MAG: PIN domain-containing protein [Planctomycetes bacterium]|nr:PIN domain-containing protein [Planctomycetota bacterium]